MPSSLRAGKSPFTDWRPWTLLLATVLVYVDVPQYEFVVFDDDVHVFENDFVRTGFTRSNLQWAFGIHGPSQWHPLAWLSHQLDCELFGLRPGWHHVMNVAYHALGVVLLYFALNRLLGRPGVSLFVAAVFAVHPLNVESVAWVSERRNVLCGVFWMTALLFYAGYARHGGWGRYLLVLAATAGALLAKPMAVTLPCVFLLLDYWPLRRLPLSEARQPHPDATVRPACPRRSGSWILLEKLPLFALAAGAAWLSYLCQDRIDVVSSLEALPLRYRLENAAVSYGLYLRRMVWPVDLAVLYPHPAFTDRDLAAVLRLPGLLWGGGLALVSAVAMGKARTRPAFLVGWFWFLGTLVPMIGLVQVGEQQLADRYAYLAMIGLALGVAGLAGMPTTAFRRRMMGGLATLAVLAWALAAWIQVGYWSDSVALFTRTVAVTSNNSRARLNLGLALHRQGHLAAAITQYQEALRIDRRYALAWYNLGIAYHDLGRLDAAIDCFQQAVMHQPRYIDAWVRLGAARGHADDLAGALSDFDHVLRLDPESAMAHLNRGLALEAIGRLDDAIDSYERAVELDPADAKARRQLNAAREKRGREPPAESLGPAD